MILSPGARSFYLRGKNDLYESVDPASFRLEQEGRDPGVFTTFSTHLLSRPGSERRRHHLFLLNRHLERLFGNASAAGVCVDHSIDLRIRVVETTLRTILSEICRMESADASPLQAFPLKIRLVLRPGDVWAIFIEPETVSLRDLPGITLSSIEAVRTNPEIKSTALAICRRARAQAEHAGAHEALLLQNGTVREGAYSNFFWFDSGGALCTPGHSILPGITRQFILNNRPCALHDAPLTDVLAEAEEAFITQSTAGIVPVVRIDGTPIGDGRPGPSTQRLRTWYAERIEEQAEAIPEYRDGP